MLDVKVFVSYSWRIPESAHIVDDVEQAIEAHPIQLLRDKKELEIGDYISAFMNKIGEAEQAIVVLSKPYFESEYCVWELLQLFQYKGYAQNIYPILADDINLGDTSPVVAFWKERRDALQAEVDADGAGNVPDKVKQLNLFEEFVIKVDGLMTRAGDMLAAQGLPNGGNDFSQILNNIAPILPTNSILPNQPDSEFITQIKQGIAEELALPGIAIFSDVLRIELNALLTEWGNSDACLDDNKASALASALVDTMASVDNQGEKVIKQVLYNAFMHCFNPRSRRYYTKAEPHHDAIKETIEQLLGWLVLSGVDEKRVAKLQPLAGFGKGLYFELPVKTEGGVEVLVSRKHQHQASVEPEDMDVKGCNAMLVTADQFQWQETATVDTLMRMLWNKVFPEAVQDVSLDKEQVKKLNARLRTLRDDPWDRQHHYIAIKCDCFSDRDAYQKTYQQLLDQLDQLTLVRFGVAEQSVFYSVEYDLMDAINYFLTKVNQLAYA